MPLSDAAFLAADADNDGLVCRAEWLEYAVAVAADMVRAKTQWAEEKRSHEQEEEKGEWQSDSAAPMGVVRLGVGDVLVRMRLARRTVPVDPLLVSATIQLALDDSIDVLEGLENAVLAPLEAGATAATTTNENEPTPSSVQA